MGERKGKLTGNELRNKLNRLNADQLEALVVIPGSDHSYYKAAFSAPETAELMPDGHMTEYWDDENLSYPESKKIQVLVIS